MIVKRSLFLLVSLVVVASMILAGCGPSETATAVVPATAVPATLSAPTDVPIQTGPIPFPDGGKSVTGGWSQEPDNVVTLYSVMTYATYASQLTLAALAEYDDKGVLVPELAAEVPSKENGGISADGLTITWKLKPGLKWSDGEPLTSADVKFTWESTVDPANTAMVAGLYSNITSIDTPDDLTAILHFAKVFPAWYMIFTDSNAARPILPKHLLEGHTALESDPFIHWPTIASGPFVLTEWVPGDHMTFLPNPNFYKGRPILDRIQIKFIPTAETALAALQTGEIDFFTDFSEAEVPTLTALEPAIHTKVMQTTDIEHMFFNMGVKAGVNDANGNLIPGSEAPVDGFCPFKDVRVRKAILLGINRESIVQTLLNGETTVADTLWPNSYWTNESLVVRAYDPNQAKSLLEEAGYTPGADGIRHGMCNGVDTKLSINFITTTKQIRVNTALVVQSNLKEIGIEFKPSHMPGGTFFGDFTSGGPLATGAYDMGDYSVGFFVDPYPSTEDFLCKSIPSAVQPLGMNTYFYCDPALDALFAESNASADPEVRKVAFDAIQKYMYDNVLVIPFYSGTTVVTYADRFLPGDSGYISNMNWNAEIWDVK
jgi:peptide/nickel transport system substrate-binding protein